MKERKFSYSSASTFESCPKQFKFQQDYTERDPEDERVRYNTLFGRVMHETMRKFYETNSWKFLRSLEHVEKVAEKYSLYAIRFFTQESQGLPLGKKYFPLTREKFEEKIRNSTLSFMKAVVKEKLYGTYTGPERTVNLRLGIGSLLVGRLGCLIVRDESGKSHVTLIDGKSSDSESVDEKQLLFYSFLLAQKMPSVDRVGFLFFDTGKTRFLFTEDSTESREKIDTAGKWMLDTISKIKRSETENYFPPVVSRETCFWCSYKTRCEEYQKTHLVKENQLSKEQQQVWDNPELQEIDLSFRPV